MTVDAVFEKLTGKPSGAESAPDEAEARNGLRHVASLGMTKFADGLIDPKLVLSWLLNGLGAPAVFVGALVPIREAGALLPQVLMAGRVAALTRRKWAWVAGSAGQGASAAGIALAALTLEGATAGWAICALLAVLAVSRALCSVSYKDVLGRTVGNTRRGSVTGAAGSAASLLVLGFAVLLISGLVQSRAVVVAAIALAALLWFLAAGLFSRLEEAPGDGRPGKGAADMAVLKGNPQLWRFILARGLLVSTALAPPYLVVLAGRETGLQALGALVLASALAAFVSSWVWGRFADHSARQVLMVAGGAGALAMLAAVALALLGLAQAWWAMPAVLFALMVAYHGVRQGRSTYLVDMAPEDARAAYAAVSNTVIGTLLLVAGAAGGIASFLGAEAVLLLFAAMALVSIRVTSGLEEVEAAAG